MNPKKIIIPVIALFIIVVTAAAPTENESLFSFSKITRTIGNIGNSIKCIGSRIEPPQETADRKVLSVALELAASTKMAVAECWGFYMAGKRPTNPESSWANVVRNVWGISRVIFRFIRETISNYRNGNVGLLEYIRGKLSGDAGTNTTNELPPTGRRTLGLLGGALTGAAGMVGVPIEQHGGEHGLGHEYYYQRDHIEYNDGNDRDMGNEDEFESAEQKASLDEYKRQQKQRDIDELKHKLRLNKLKQELLQDEYKKERVTGAYNNIRDRARDIEYDDMQYLIQQNRNWNLNNQQTHKSTQNTEIHIHEAPREDKFVMVAPPPAPATVIQQSVNVQTGNVAKKPKKSKAKSTSVGTVAS